FAEVAGGSGSLALPPYLPNTEELSVSSPSALDHEFVDDYHANRFSGLPSGTCWRSSYVTEDERVSDRIDPLKWRREFQRIRFPAAKRDQRALITAVVCCIAAFLGALLIGFPGTTFAIQCLRSFGALWAVGCVAFAMLFALPVVWQLLRY